MKRLFSVWLVLLLPFFAAGQSPSTGFVFQDTAARSIISPYILVLEDKTGELSLSDVLRKDTSFKNTNRIIPNLGISNSAFWLKFSITNKTDFANLLLEIGYPVIDEITLYSPSESGYRETKAGDVLPFYKRNFDQPNFIFRLNIPSGNVQTYYLRMRSGEQVFVPMYLGVPESILEESYAENLIFGLYIGIILVMFFYNLFIYFTVNDKTYLYYVIYILFVGLTQAALEGFSYKYLWPSSPWLAIHSIYLAPSLTGIAAITFIRNFLQTAKHTPLLHKGLNIFIAAYILSFVFAFFNLYNLSYTIVNVNGLICSLYLVIMAYLILRKGFRPALFFLIAWISFLASVILFVLKDFEVLPYNSFISNILQIGSGFEVVLLSLALADRINILKKEKEQSQQDALNALRENERIIKQQNAMLDQKVKERTKELEKSNEDLEVALKNLKETQSQLVTSEKMASLGQLTAGVAHEINNPINFVTSSIKPLKRDIEDIMSVLEKYDQLSEDNFNNKKKEITQFKEDIDLDYIKTEISSLLVGIDEGASRTAEIVKGLRTFSRIDETDLKKVDLNEGLDSTLVLLNSLMRDKIIVEKNYELMQKVECFAGKINQVFMNILNNSVQAIFEKEKAGSYEGKIVISTREKGDHVIISIKDNGVGIPEEVKSKIYDPFFTTKDVGEGTGLGLSIVYNIVESHHGKIDCYTEVGKGTEFIIILPKLQPN